MTKNAIQLANPIGRILSWVLDGSPRRRMQVIYWEKWLCNKHVANILQQLSRAYYKIIYPFTRSLCYQYPNNQRTISFEIKPALISETTIPYLWKNKMANHQSKISLLWKAFSDEGFFIPVINYTAWVDAKHLPQPINHIQHFTFQIITLPASIEVISSLPTICYTQLFFQFFISLHNKCLLVNSHSRYC